MILLLCPAAHADRPVTEVIREIGIDQKLDAQLPLDLEFLNEKGEKVQLRNYFGDKPVVLTFVYYSCPMLCPMTLNALTSALRTLRFDAGKDFRVLTVSFDPKDTPQQALEKKNYYLKQYKRPGAEKGWSYLTGSEASIRSLVETVGFRYVANAPARQFAHASGFIVITPEGRISRYFYGVEYAPKDLKLALIEAGKGRIGNLVDQLLLLCYHYNPMTGRYGFAIQNTLRVSGVATLLALGSFVALALRGEKTGTSSKA